MRNTLSKRPRRAINRTPLMITATELVVTYSDVLKKYASARTELRKAAKQLESMVLRRSELERAMRDNGIENLIQDWKLNPPFAVE